MPSLTNRFDLALVPVAGVGEHDVGISGDLGAAQLALDGANHRFEMAEVRGIGSQLGGDDDLLVGDGHLRVVALQRLEAVRAHRPRVMVGEIDQAARDELRLVRLDHPGGHAPRPVCRNPAGPPGVVCSMGGVVVVELLFKASAGLKEPVGAVLGDRTALAIPLGIQRSAPLAHPRPTAFRPRDELARIELHRDRLGVAGAVGAGRRGPLPMLAFQALLGSRSARRRPSGVRNCSGSSSPRSSP